MKHTQTIATLSLGLLPLSLAQDKQQPNIVIIYADDVGYGDLSCYGGTVPTPHCDSLARDGLLMKRAYAAAATSTPSRFALMTGLYPFRQKGTGVAAGNAGMVIRPERYTIADAAKSAGYRTGAIGKWHLGIGETAKQNWNGSITPNLSDIGFDDTFIMAATGDRVPCVFIENDRVYNYDPTAPISVSYQKPFEGEPTGRKNPELLKLHPSHGHDQAIVNGISRIGYMKGGGKALWVDEDFADVIAQRAKKFIKENKDTPFFLFFGTHDIHVPRVPHPRFVGKTDMGPRGDAIVQFDFQVGEVLSALREAGVADNTIVILSSDNGPVLDDGYKEQAKERNGKHQSAGELRGGKYSSFEAGTRVPLLVRWPKHIKAGSTSTALFSQVDLLATLSTIMGAETPEGLQLDSQDAGAALLARDLEKGREHLAQLSMGGIGLVSGKWKYIPANGGAAYSKYTDIELGNARQDQLYDLSSDPGERNNLAPKNAQQLQKMKEIHRGIVK